MDFSILMSVYGKDDPEFFRQALESVTVKQTLRPNQVVIVLDGPVPDEIRQTIKLLSDHNDSIEFTLVDKEKNAGLAAALNSGLVACRYEWVARMDSDDISASDRFEKQIAYLLKHPEVQVLGGYIREFEGAISFVKMTSVRKVPLTHMCIVNMAKMRTPFNHVSVMYRKKAVLEVGGYSEDFGKLEDYKLWVDLISNGVRLANLPDVLCYVRVGKDFIKRRSNKREIKDWDMLQSHLIKSGIITEHEALKNKLYIRAFIHMPGWMKKIAYKSILRE